MLTELFPTRTPESRFLARKLLHRIRHRCHLHMPVALNECRICSRLWGTRKRAWRRSDDGKNNCESECRPCADPKTTSNQLFNHECAPSDSLLGQNFRST